MDNMKDMNDSEGSSVKLDMLFLLGFFFTIIGSMVLSGWFLGGGFLNIYGAAMLAAGLVLVIWRPKPPWKFFLGRAGPEETKPGFVRCVCGRMQKPGEIHVHGYDPKKGYYVDKMAEDEPK